MAFTKSRHLLMNFWAITYVRNPRFITRLSHFFFNQGFFAWLEYMYVSLDEKNHLYNNSFWTEDFFL